MYGLKLQWLLDPEKVDRAASFNLFANIMVDYLE